MKQAVVALAALVFAGSALAEGVSGIALYSLQRSNRAAFGMYVIGFIDGAFAQAAVTKPESAKVFHCMPPNANYEQAVDVVAKYLEDTPQFRNETGALLVTVALQKAWPCP